MTRAAVRRYRFNAAFPSGRNSKWIDVGLWSRSRHPNYFGETTLWFGLALVCLSGAPTAYSLGVCAVTPIWSFAFLLFTSLMLLEKRSDAKWGTDPKYLAYKARTPVWMPRL
jgi:steroid 5-alpha reductase family enzyme